MGLSTRMVSALFFASVFLTATLSAIFGMAGGLVLMAVLISLYPVAPTMVTHGFIQSVSNGSRAYFLRDYIMWRCLALFAAGALLAFAALYFVSISVDRATVFIMLGFVGFSVWIPKSWFNPDPRQIFGGLACGAIITGLNIVAGVSGPLPDVFFQKLEADRRAIVATKAATQVLSHLAKIGFYISAALAMSEGPALWMLLLAIPLSIAGTRMGGIVLNRMSDASFRNWTKWIVTGLGAIFLVRGVLLFLS
jgi:uncharacterized membrane protein YfcA